MTRVIHHIVKSGRMYFIEIDIVVGPDFVLQTVAEQDTLRERVVPRWACRSTRPG